MKDTPTKVKDPPTKTYYSISEVSESAKVKAHVLRYWESQFSMLRPRKGRGGIRMYRQKDLSLIREIKHLLYDRGFTIAGAKRRLLEDRRAAGQEVPPAGARPAGIGRARQGNLLQESGPGRPGLVADIRRELVRLRDMLEQGRDFPGDGED